MTEATEAGNARRVLRVGLTQWRATRDIAANLEAAEWVIAESASGGADLVLLPENGLMLGTNTEMRAAALRPDGPELSRLGAAAKAAGVPVILGGTKLIRENGAVTNTAVVFGPDGALIGGYDKIHLFDARVGGQSFEASAVESAGTDPVLLEVSGTVVGLTICYDVRFPELYRRLALAGAEVLLVPAAFIQETGRAHWEVLLRARAIENGAFVVASATIVGEDGSDAFATYGHATAVAPWGEVLADLRETPLGAQVVKLDLEQVASARSRLPVLAGVRDDVYRTRPRTIPVLQAAHVRESA
ncbi:nitrilase-related carbon-nitrogen hydrolase [Rhodococcus koreensis]